MPQETAKQQRVADMRALVKDLNKQYTPDRIRTGFICRALDEELEAIGALALGDRAVFVDPHIVVWTGYEVATESKYYHNW